MRKNNQNVTKSRFFSKKFANQILLKNGQKKILFYVVIALSNILYFARQSTLVHKGEV